MKGSTLLVASLAVVLVVSALPQSVAAAEVVNLFLLPHTHADVGWLETVDALSRVNVSRILNGVVGSLMNDTQHRRRFVWDEMAFLQLWWDEQATAQQKANFQQLVREKRIEFVDNGWSQHDMGCTTYDSMISNWEEGHLWLKDKFGEESQPKIGCSKGLTDGTKDRLTVWPRSLDPFGMSSSQAVLQALMGMEAWFFTRISGDLVDELKQSKGLEFVWRASSALPASQSEIFSHVFESYYCMPLPTYAFEWGAAKGAAVPTADNILNLAWGLANISKQRSEWFLTPNVLIPWGCDYQYQNADLMYNSTDWLIDIINAHPEWGVHVQYTTPSEYLSAVKSDASKQNLQFPVKTNGTSFFPFNDWSGYFTSRPSLKGHSQASVSLLLSTEALYTLHGHQVLTSAEQSLLWPALELARRNNGIVQHHDAITGTGCDNAEGCSGTDQVVGPHGVISDYQKMLTESMAASTKVASLVLSRTAGFSDDRMSMDPSALGKRLMGAGNGGEDALLVVYNPLASVRSEIVTVPVPVCALTVKDAETGEPVISQVTASLGIGDGQPPYYDFELSFEATRLPPLGLRRFIISPSSDGNCGGGDLDSHSASFVRHDDPRWQPAAKEAIIQEAIRRQGEVCGDPDRWDRILKQTERAMASEGASSFISVENDFMKVYVDLDQGIQAVLDKSTGQNYSVQHELVAYKTSTNDAYAFSPIGEAVPLLRNRSTMASTIARGPVMHEVRLQISQEHKTRIRLWQSTDPAVGGRIEFAHRIGVLERQTEIASRFTLGGLGAEIPALYAEENGYEVTRHEAGTGADNIAKNLYPSQMSTFIANSTTQLSLALDRSHAVGSLLNGTLEVMQHRRGGPFNGNGGTVVLDDTDRILTQTWLSVGDTGKANRARVVMRQRLNHPLLIAHRPFDASVPLPKLHQTALGLNESLPESLHLQSVRATAALPNSPWLARVQHLFTNGEDPELSQPQMLDVGKLFGTLRSSSAVQEMTLDGMRNVSTMQKRQRFPATAAANAPSSTMIDSVQRAADVIMRPFEIRTFQLD